MSEFATIGLTGGVACGKTTVRAALAGCGFGVIDADQIAREVVQPGTAGFDEIVGVFGNGVRDVETGGLNRRALADIVFEDREELGRLQSIIHPRVYARIALEMEELRRTQPVLVEVPLLYETAGSDRFDQVWVVACSPEVQIRRAQARGWDIREFHRRNAAQMPLQEKMDAADLVIWNELSLDWLNPQIEEALKILGDTGCWLRGE